MRAEKKAFGVTKNNESVNLFCLTSAGGLVVELISYGAAIKSVLFPDEITYGFDSLAEYEENRFFFGAAIGRYANRIARGQFFLDGKEYRLAQNNGSNHLHGGVMGFDRRVWKSELRQDADGEARAAFSIKSPEGEEGYPGNVSARVTYTLTDSNELRIIYEASSDAGTPFNPTNHAFWNLAGTASGSINGHILRLCCPFYLPVDSEFIPTGEILSVKNTPMDFLNEKPIGRDIDSAKPAGYDHCFVIDGVPGELNLAAVARDPVSHRRMEVWTTMPGIQVYSGNNIKNARISGGAEAKWRGAFCLETEFFPDSVNKQHFPSAILMRGKDFYSQTIYKFGF
jgi:aldose 1-epimerase